jgi:hypothetical protein
VSCIALLNSFLDRAIFGSSPHVELGEGGQTPNGFCYRLPPDLVDRVVAEAKNQPLVE